MKILIIEDEKPAARQLERLLQRSEEFEGSIHGPLESIAQTVDHLREHSNYDLILMDIHLADGPSFEIFESVDPSTPIIFCTAYDQYALEAFKLNSIDYLLKPIEPADLDRALQKYKKLHAQRQTPELSAAEILKALQKPKEESKSYKERFMIKLGDRIISRETREVQFFYSAEKASFLQDQDGRSYPIEYSLDQVEASVPNRDFFRINRKYLIRFEAIREMHSYSGSRIKLHLMHCDDDDILVSRDRTAEFKHWLDS
ncbi:LytR/AlgR family response regulator transcription factor [Croceimicrobium hydrocarbonivorans]|uniref:Response regulator transcription factor n=1 Tax=Croceimicrobium hydrocarbonivorans TaxID=2761580 RepID=A0A7H0VBK7_9FLAO|nr:LytTR family DNA-binding domain-containing protein [Croceimicrobium hydrocarbonivorans]QNR23105.1 response regulator transcription factor [Croceimicrobium hydrocarbonivorans]